MNMTDRQAQAALFDAGAAAARSLPPEGEISARRLAKALRLRVEPLRRAVRHWQRLGGELPGAACWLLDNAWLARQEYLAALGALRQARGLRRSGSTALILGLCRALLEQTDGEAEEAACRAFLEGFQSRRGLRRAELQLFPAALRCAALERLAAACACFTPESEGRLARLFTTLRWLAAWNPEALLRAADRTDAVLCADPTGDYARMDSATRGAYCERVAALARERGQEEPACARELIRLAREQNCHVGFLLFPQPKESRARLYLTARLLLSMSLSLALAFAAGLPAAALLLLLPVSELVRSLLDFVLAHLTRPRRMPRMETKDGVPPEGRTICVLSCLLTDRRCAEAMAARLEELRLVCRAEGENLCFGLLADLPEADRPTRPEDAAILEAASAAVRSLNERYGGGFYLFTRPRTLQGGRWAGFDRKRGALLALARLLGGESCELEVVGEREKLAGLRYILTLDSDTRLYPGAAGALIGAMLHPLNRARPDPLRGVVTGGWGVMQPRLATELRSARETDFALVFAGSGGSDPYGGPGGELQMDAFGSCAFTGKGILDARALLSCTASLPAGQILSHDAVEGALLRCALVGDAEASDAFPARPLAYYRRLHRWTRGDWQNLPFLFVRRLDALSRHRLLENLRRSLLPVGTLAAVLAGFFLPESGLTIAAWAALAALLSGLLTALAEGSLRRAARLRRYARLLTGVGGAIVQTFFRLWLLPCEAWTCLTALFTALWRLAVSRRGLLQWQTAAQSEGQGRSLAAHLRAFWQSAALGLLLLAFSPAVLGKSVGLLWLLSPITAFALALPAQKEQSLPEADRAWLRAAAAEAYGFFSACCTAEDHFLPPDHFQAQPPLGAAHRTSPTNIGLCLASHAAAAELELISREEAGGRMARLLGTLERMEKWRGHLYNWVDTRTLRPLAPATLSTVDSGNLCASLLTAGSALRRWGCEELAERALALAAAMDFAPLYDPDRELFAISFDPARQRRLGGWYDLMASEALLTSYLAVARGDVPARHWRRLSRAQLQKDGYRGLASWTGTMFEYLMPPLFLPLYPGSLLQESARFCLYAQQRQRLPGKPWGLSECAYYALGPDLEYRYKAVGCAALALKRGQEADAAVAPYASFLALAVDPRAAAENLRRLDRFGARGRFGLMEALDFTPERCEHSGGERVDSYMAHHIGMSILAVANALCDGVMRSHFFADPAMRAYSLLLQERLPESPAVLRRDGRELPERPRREPEAHWQREDEGRMCLLTNGVWHLRPDSSSGCAASCGELAVYDAPGPRWEGLPPAVHWSFEESAAGFRGGDETLSFRQELFAAAGELGEGRLLTLEAAQDRELTLTLRFEPLLCARRDWESHPAFWQLGLEGEQIDQGLLLHRYRRGGQRACWLCLLCDGAAAVGSFRPPEAQLALSLRLPAGQPRELRLALCFGWDRQSALDGARAILRTPRRSDLAGALARRLGMEGEEVDAAMALLPLLEREQGGGAPQRALWALGLSGDMPILCCDARSRRALPLLHRWLLLRSCGVEADLVFFTAEDGEYRQPERQRILEALGRLGLEALLGCRAGLHFVPRAAAETVVSRAAFSAGELRLSPPALTLPRFGAERQRGQVPPFRQEGACFIFHAGGQLPGRAWQLPLSNGRLGCLAADCGPAALWLDNARLQPLTPPMRDIRGTQPPEALWLELDGEPVSLFAANDGRPCVLRFEPGLARWEKEIGGRWITTELFLSCDEQLRFLRVEGAAGRRLHWQMRLQLAETGAAALRGGFADGLFSAENPESPDPALRFLAGANVPAQSEGDFSPPAPALCLEAEEETLLLCGCCPAETLRRLADPARARQEREKTLAFWRLRRGDKSGERGALGRYLDNWAVYQTLACRLMARSSLYQTGGAWGFRDQLQDACNLLPLDSGPARERILAACRHQYAEGDVMHWWHALPEGDRGLRSRCADDLLWLPWALCEYCEATEDLSLCRREVPWLISPPLAPSERDRYETPRTGGTATVLDHARAALSRCAARGFGEHGLPFFGSGDWNDGLDAVDGESLWLGFFLSHVADRMAALLERLGEDAAAERALSRRSGEAADACFNGHFYPRGYWADGSVLGGEERIDALPQAWAAFCPWADGAKVDAALDEALRRLVDERAGLVRLMAPPFGEEERYPGYLAGYGPGVRENGGQYTHAAVWLARACLQRGRTAQARRLLELLLPENHDPGRYEAEPFVLPADVCAAPGREGEAGWTWYTGSAGWFWRTARELRRREEKG